MFIIFTATVVILFIMAVIDYHNDPPKGVQIRLDFMAALGIIIFFAAIFVWIFTDDATDYEVHQYLQGDGKKNAQRKNSL